MREVEILRGDPKKAIVKLSIPIMISNLFFTIYNLADGAWVSGLGADALSAIGIFFPLFMVFMALSIGLGVGASSAISRRIGANDKKGADSTATHAIMLGLLLAFSTFLIIPYLEYLLRLIGAKGNVLNLALKYSKIILAGMFFLIFNNIASGIMNGEGNTKRTMYANTIGTIVNIILDPIFIYILGFGIAGAAYATVVSMSISSAIFIYWLLSGKSFVDVRFCRFCANRKILLDILRVGLPSSFSMLSMSFSMIFLNTMIIKAGGSDGIAVFTSAWRLISFGFIPLFGISAATTAVVGSSFGARNALNLRKAYFHALKLAILVEVFIVLLIITFAPKISLLFTYSEASVRIYKELVYTLRILPLFLIFTPLSITTVAMFQGIGKGENSLAITILRTMVFQLSFAYVLAFSFGLRFYGILFGIVLGNIAASLLAFIWGRLTVKELERMLVVRA